ncbi:A-kinase anchor protein 10, mitochondrial isoform X1 [Schistocerca americana]|uniref:A-kinase anchor protein 10, mitochondrial isoform X1 n=1 Tax=Schistocerca americana TaxID=7009 RepID=UPI001F4F874F|nr:A-kinase anchor protein 10, mitochondrial isoform X1 [Schistocerca americana]
MLQFWKKNGMKDASHSNANSPSRTTDAPNPSIYNGDVSNDVLHSGPLSCYSESELTIGDLGESDQRTKGNNSHSRLSKTLAEVLADKGALGYFIQYLEARGYVALIKFWLDAESFRAASSAEIRCSTDTPDVQVTREMLEAECTSSKESPHHEERNVVSLQTAYSSLSVDCVENSESANTAPKGSTHSLIVSSTLSTASHTTYYDAHSHMFGCASGASNKNVPSDLKDCGETCSDVSDISNSSENKTNCVTPDIDAGSRINTYQLQTIGDGYESKKESSSGTVARWASGAVSPIHQAASPTRAVKLIEATLHDAVRIFRKYFTHNARYRIRIPEEIRNRMISAICREGGMVGIDCFNECQDLVFHIMERDFFNDFLRSDYHCKHQIDVLTSGNVLLTDILYNDNALFYFTEFMEQEGHRSLVEFWLAAVNFRQHLLEKKGVYDPVEAQNDAIILYDKYFSLQATCPLGFSDKIRFEIEQNICREDGPLPDCFEKPVRIVLHVLEKNYLQPFQSSQLFFNYLSELISTIQSGSSLLLRSRKCGSECSSELSLSAQNTLLATEDSSSTPRRIVCKLDDRQMSIDSRQLYDPDSLWRRKRHRDLSFGRITVLGRYESDVEPEPDRKEESRLTRVVKKLVNMEEDKAKEELAWQIAEMIVKDVTNLTMGSEDEE